MRKPAIVFKVFTSAEVLLWSAPPVIVASMALLFSSLSDVLGPRRGYLVSFAFYWAFWCVAFPVFVLGSGEALAPLRPVALPGGMTGVAVAVALLGPPLVAGAWLFLPRWRAATPAILLASAAIALVNGVGEELLWRGAYVHHFRDNPLIAVVYPALGFGVWHLAPLIVLPTRQRGGAMAFVAAAVVLGLVWGWVALVLDSVALTAAAHVVTDFLGLGGFAYLAGRAGSAEAPLPLAVSGR